MKLLSNSNLLSFFCVIVISFSCSKKEEQTIKTLGKATVVLAKNFSKLDVCGCNEQGNLILDSSITIMKPLKNIKNLRNSNAEKIEMRSLHDRWSALMSSCFKKHGANMWVFSDSNDLETITEKKDTLYNLGIQIDRGDLLKL